MHLKLLFGLCSLLSVALAAPSLRAPEKRATAPWFVGINLSGAEFGDGKYPGVYNTDYTWYTHSEIDQFVAQGFNMFRLNFAMERMTLGSLTATLDKNYLGNLTDVHFSILAIADDTMS
jgi:endoglucanase